MKELNKKIEQEYQKSIKVRNVNLCNSSYKQQQKIMKEQDESYKKCFFFKQLRKAVEKGIKYENRSKDNKL